MICHYIRDAIVVVFPCTATEKTVIAIVVQTKCCAFNGVPIIDSAIHGTLGFEKLPVSMEPNHNTRFTGGCEHIQHAVNYDPGPNTVLIVECQKVLRIEQIPLSIFISKGMSIDCERLIRNQYKARVLEWTQRTCVSCDP